MKKVKVLIFDEENKSLHEEKFKQLAGEYIETEKNLYSLEDTKKYFNESDGTMTYFINVPLPDRIHTENLKKLRRSVAIQNMFNYDVKKGISITAMMPWIIMIVLILFN